MSGELARVAERIACSGKTYMLIDVELERC